MAILNLTQHNATPEQVAAGVFEPTTEVKAQIVELLNFNELPSRGFVYKRAEALVSLIPKGCSVMIGGAPFLMSPLVAVLDKYGIEFVYAFSARVSTEEVQPDGSTKKVSVFKHIGFV